MEKQKAIESIRQQLSELLQLGCTTSDNEPFKKWQRNTRIFLENVFGKEAEQVKEFKRIHFSAGIMTSDERRQALLDREAYDRGISNIKPFLESLINEIEKFWDKEEEEAVVQNDPATFLTLLFDRFHSVTRQLQSRHEHRQTISIDDEYDVQDLLHALLKIYFDDIRPEEWTPSYAGKSSRMDFLLKKERFVIEVKKTRKDLGVKEIGDQLIIDIERYAQHHDCKNLICFVYDPEGRIGNPAGLEGDLNRAEKGLNVMVFVRPKPT